MKGNILIGLILAFIIGAAIGWFIGASFSKQVASDLQFGMNQPIKTQQIASSGEFDLRTGMRKLWEDHINWTRSYIVSAAYDNKDTDAVAQRLLKNQEDIGNAIKPYYGEEAGNKLTELLKTHITTATEIIAAAKSKDQNAQNIANNKWYANANEIADFLANANPNWPRNELRTEMREHLDLTQQEAVDILSNKYEAGVADYDKVHEQILKMADMLSSGIVKQFPEKFR